jgi:hypothetical protein
MESLTATTENIIVASRRKCTEDGDYVGALNMLGERLPFSEPAGAIEAEITRLHIIQGNWKSALLVLAEREATTHNDTGPYRDLLSILEAFINVFVSGDLAGALQLATSVWHRDSTTATPDDEDEVLVRLRE